jgi:hypothetical protein
VFLAIVAVSAGLLVAGALFPGVRFFWSVAAVMGISVASVGGLVLLAAFPLLWVGITHDANTLAQHLDRLTAEDLPPPGWRKPAERRGTG